MFAHISSRIYWCHWLRFILISVCHAHQLWALRRLMELICYFWNCSFFWRHSKVSRSWKLTGGFHQPAEENCMHTWYFFILPVPLLLSLHWENASWNALNQECFCPSICWLSLYLLFNSIFFPLSYCIWLKKLLLANSKCAHEFLKLMEKRKCCVKLIFNHLYSL